MAYNFNDLPSDLGRVCFKDEEFIVVTIHDYNNFDGDRELSYELINVATGEHEKMIFNPITK